MDSAERAREGDSGPAGWVATAKGAVLVALLLAAVWYALHHDVRSAAEVREVVDGHGAWSVVVFGVLYALVGATPVPVTVMAVSGGWLFGVLEGGLLSIVASSVGAWLGYLLARMLGRDALLHWLGPRVDAAVERLDGRSPQMVLFLRLVPMFPYWAVNYGSGLAGVRTRPYLTATVLGGAPGQISLVAVGAYAADPSRAAGAVVMVAWAAVVVLTVLAWRAYRRSARTPRAPRSAAAG